MTLIIFAELDEPRRQGCYKKGLSMRLLAVESSEDSHTVGSEAGR